MNRNSTSQQSPPPYIPGDDFLTSRSDTVVGQNETPAATPATVNESATQPAYKLYKRRFLGVLGIFILNIAVGMNWPWFGPISNKVSQDFHISLNQINWLGNVIPIIYLPSAPLVPWICSKVGLRKCYFLATFLLLASVWLRVAGTASGLSGPGRYALLILAQFIFGVSQAFVLVLPPKYSQTWFDSEGRITATMIMSVSDPIGAALGQAIAPNTGSARHSILILALISTAATPFALLIGDKPPTPPSYSGGQDSPSMLMTVKALLGLLPDPQEAILAGKKVSELEVQSFMSRRERLDFGILFMIFGSLVASTQAFSFLSNEMLEPYGYSEDTAGFLGAALFLSGIVGAVITAPIFDRVLTHHLGISARIFSPIVSLAWLSLIWAVKPHNLAALYVIFVLIGVFSLILLPVALELGGELTRAPDASASLLWWNASFLTFVFNEVCTALRAGPSGNPPLNMHRAFIFLGVFDLCLSGLAIFFRGKQVRREMDERMKSSTSLDGSAVVDLTVGVVNPADKEKDKMKGIIMPLGPPKRLSIQVPNLPPIVLETM